MLFVSLASVYAQCNFQNTGPFRAGQSLRLVPTTSEVPISGSISIVDGCTLRMNDVSIRSLKNRSLNISVYGGLSGNSWGVKLSSRRFRGNGIAVNRDILLADAPVKSISFANFNEIRLFDENSRAFIGFGGLETIVPPSNNDDYYPTATFTRTPRPTHYEPSQTFYEPTASLTYPASSATHATSSVPNSVAPSSSSSAPAKSTPTPNVGFSATAATFLSGLGAMLWAVAV